jgi:hypothetical protein
MPGLSFLVRTAVIDFVPPISIEQMGLKGLPAGIPRREAAFC